MKITSNYVKKQFDVVTQEVESEGNVLTLITHGSLEDILLHQLPAVAPEICPVSFDFSVVKAERGHSVVLCTVYDATGRRIQAVGESVTETLTNNIAITIPTTMASNRAFDRAVIRYLMLPGKLYSDSEISPDTAVKAEEPVATPTVSETVEEEPEELPVAAPVSSPEEKGKKATSMTLEEAKKVICSAGAAKGKSMELALKDNEKIVRFIASGKFKSASKEEEEAAKILIDNL